MNDLILYLSITSSIGIIFFAFKKLEMGAALNIAILALTALALVWTTIDAKRSATEALQADFRPVILRDGVTNWTALKELIESKETNINFFVANNIATNVTGYIVLDGKKYELSLAVGRSGAIPNQVEAGVDRNSSVTWSLPNKLLMGKTYPDRFIVSDEPEGFYLFYRDIEGNKYTTFEDSQLHITSERLQ